MVFFLHLVMSFNGTKHLCFFIIFQLFILFGMSAQQNSFNIQLEELSSRYARSVKDSSLFYSKISDLKKEYRDSITNCPYSYLINKKLGAYFFNVLQDDRRALEIQKSVLSQQLSCIDSMSSDIAITYFNIAQALDFLGETKKAEQYYYKVIAIENKLSNPHSSSSNHFTEIGNFYAFQGDNAKAIFYFEKAEASHLGAKNSYYRNLLRAKSMILEKEGLHQEAISILKEALEISQQLKNDEAIKAARISDDISKQYRFIGDFTSAEKYILKAISIAKQAKDLRPQDLNNLYNHHSHIKKEQGKYEDAIQLLLKVRQSYFENIATTELSRISGNYENSGDIYYLQGNYEKALKTYQEGMQFLANDLSSNYLEHPSIKNKQFIGESHLLRQLGLKAKTLFALAEKSRNKELYASTLLAVEKYDTLNRRLFKENWDENSYLPILASSRQFYQVGIKSAQYLFENADQKEYLERAYAIVAKLKSQLLDRSINIEEYKSQEFSKDILNTEKRLQDSVTLKSKQYQRVDIASKKERKEAFNKLAKHKIELALFQKKSGIDKVVEKSETIQTPNIQDIQTYLNANEGLLEFHIHENQLHYFYLTKTTAILRKSVLDQDTIIAYYDKLTKGAQVESFLPKDLTELLQQSKKNKLIIIPDQALLQIPFESIPLDNNSLWIDKFEISYEYGSNFLYGKNTPNKNNRLAVYASDYKTDRFSNSSSQNKIHYPELTHTISEAHSAQSILDGKLYTNNTATKENFKSASQEFGLFHFALHGTLDRNNPDNSALIFEKDNGPDELTASEIYNLNLPANLIVLSACNSGAGPVAVGDGVRSLTRSFIHAGSASVVTSLWESTDASTRTILDHFYTLLKSGKTKSEALRLAKLAYIKNASPTFKHPKYWAHLILVGDDSSLYFNSNFLPIAGLVLLLITALFYFFSRQKKTRRI